MWNCVDKHIARLTTDTGAVACPRPECQMSGAFKNEMHFKNHACKYHGIELRAPNWRCISPTALRRDTQCSLRTSPTLSVSYVENTADVDELFSLAQCGDSTNTFEAEVPNTSPHPRLFDIGSLRYLEEKQGDLKYITRASVLWTECEAVSPSRVQTECVAEEGGKSPTGSVASSKPTKRAPSENQVLVPGPMQSTHGQDHEKSCRPGHVSPSPRLKITLTFRKQEGHDLTRTPKIILKRKEKARVSKPPPKRKIIILKQNARESTCRK